MQKQGWNWHRKTGKRKMKSMMTNQASKIWGKKPPEWSEEDQRVQDAVEEAEAVSRQIYDPVRKEYDDRCRRATDLKECSRVTLPKPLGVANEAMIEMRREAHMRVFREFREKHCVRDGSQKSNLTEEEQEGLKTLMKRIKEGELVVMKTDKSGKFCVTTKEKYVEMGMDHVKNDKEVTREELREVERHLNGHTAAWCIMFSTGENHSHTSRIIKSKTTFSNNIANLYLMYKDHKIAVDQTSGYSNIQQHNRAV